LEATNKGRFLIRCIARSPVPDDWVYLQAIGTRTRFVQFRLRLTNCGIQIHLPFALTKLRTILLQFEKIRIDSDAQPAI
jgi:hypothetical protein